MKTIKAIGLLFITALVCFTTPSCGDKDKDDPAPPSSDNPQHPGQGSTDKDPFANIPEEEEFPFAGVWYLSNSNKTTEHYLRIDTTGTATYYIFRGSNSISYSFCNLVKTAPGDVYTSYNCPKPGYDILQIKKAGKKLTVTFSDFEASKLSGYDKYWNRGTAQQISDDYLPSLKWLYSWEYSCSDEESLKSRFSGISYMSYKDTLFSNAIINRWSGICGDEPVWVDFEKSAYHDALFKTSKLSGLYKLAGDKLYLSGDTHILRLWGDAEKPYTRYHISFGDEGAKMYWASDYGKEMFEFDRYYD